MPKTAKSKKAAPQKGAVSVKPKAGVTFGKGVKIGSKVR